MSGITYYLHFRLKIIADSIGSSPSSEWIRHSKYISCKLNKSWSICLS